MLNKLNIHLSPDELVGDGVGEQEQDPLSGAAAGWEAPKFPLLMPDRICEFKIHKSTKAETKEDKDREAITLVLKTEHDYTGADGKPLRSGFTVYKRIGITPSEATDDKRARTWKNIGEDLAMALKATGKTDNTPRDLINDPAMIEGIIVKCRVGISKGTNNFPDSNTLTFVLPA